MKQFLVLFREPDGRTLPHTAEETLQHQRNVKEWMAPLVANGRLAGGQALTLSGNVIRGRNKKAEEGLYKVGKEIVGGYMLLNATNLQEATDIITECPVLDFGGFAEVRETM